MGIFVPWGIILDSIVTHHTLTTVAKERIRNMDKILYVSMLIEVMFIMVCNDK